MNQRAIGYGLALAAGMAYGLNAVLIRQTVSAFGAPLVGSSIALAMGVVSLGLLAWITRGGVSEGKRLPRRAIVFLLISGLGSAIGVGSNFVALSLAPVVVVSPITATNPLITILLSRLFLQRSERVNLRVVLGGCLVVGGIGVITLSR